MPLSPCNHGHESAGKAGDGGAGGGSGGAGMPGGAGGIAQHPVHAAVAFKAVMTVSATWHGNCCMDSTVIVELRRL